MPDLSTFFVANVLGAIGYAGFALSPLARSRLKYLVIHGVAMIPIAVHYVMLGAIPGALLSLVYLGADLLGARWPGNRKALAGLTAVAIAAFIPTYEQLTDLLGLIGTLIFVASRAVTGHRATLAVAAVSTVTWGAYGWVEGSWSQVGFSFAYAVFCCYSLWRIGRDDARSA